jgi:uncharacterized protein
MNYISSKTFLVVIIFVLNFPAAYTQIDTLDGFEVFYMESGDSVITMKKYYLCILFSGPDRSHSAEESAEIQARHMEYISKMAEEKKICLAGPFAGDPEWRGVFLFSVRSLEEAQQLVSGDPAVQSGRLRFEIRPWWGMIGTTLF